MRRLIGLIVLFFLFSSFIIAQEEITNSLIKSFRESTIKNPMDVAMINALTNNKINALVLNRDVLNKHNTIFNVELKKYGITNQKQTGRCWLFAALNIAKRKVAADYKLNKFELSQSYPFFWDKLEKANMFLESVIKYYNKKFDDRELQILFSDPIPDGGWWYYAVKLIEKYGVVPKSVMPETVNSSSSRSMNRILGNYLRKQGVKFINELKSGKSVDEVRKEKIEALKTVYKILVYHLGNPPEKFVWRFKDGDGKIIEKSYTPVEFYKKVVKLNLNDYVTLCDHPVYEYNKLYVIKDTRNFANLPDMDFINLPIDQLKKYTLQSILGKEAVWFGADVGWDHYSKEGIFSTKVYDYKDLLGFDVRLSKKERLMYKAGAPNHAMVLLGVDTLSNGKPSKWLVENSWGTKNGDNGYWTMYDDWFDEHVYTVIINKKYLPKKVLAILKQKPQVLPPWDPMHDFFYNK